MKIKRYKGASLEKIREVVLKELGENAVIVNIQKLPGGGVLSLGKKGGFEVIAAADEALDADAAPLPQVAVKQFESAMDEQKQQYRGLKQSLKLLDDKLLEMGERMETIAAKDLLDADGDSLANVHPQWREKVAAMAREIAHGSNPSKEDWHEAVASLVPTAGGILFRPTPGAPPDVYVLVGSTGVGKTTTLAKLAAKCVLGNNLNVGVVSVDTFRVAAVDQLREYAQLLGVEMAVAFSPDELKGQIAKFADKDVVFIDTPGRGHFDEAGINAIKECVSLLGGVCCVLVVPASLRQEEAQALQDSYGKLNPAALIISKTDEAARCDGLTKLFDVTGLPVLYLTDGQRVPEDIHVASPGVVASLIMPLVEPSEPIKTGGAAHGPRKRPGVVPQKRG